MTLVRPRHAVRAIILDEADRILLCRLDVPRPAGRIVVWVTPGGGIEPGEAPLTALRRELREEVGLAIEADPPHVWHQVVIDREHTEGHDGVINDFFLVRTASFHPRGSLSAAELAAELIVEFRWWPLPDIASYRGPDLFSPRDLATPLAALIADEVPSPPVRLGL
ncbi:NUDIX domain-containing protein [Nonomuraea jiangxiensis]|uniref:8-oxo-dGTP pyrophosphatase MutT, NUDIX family n=1 Tax=Nonomuraea jiangxiensis TaxID=633440 RepID=A0A1G9R019_9ACTN|nr:NUDIX domain-containing protein [Nonomuraea jiangxiensis]SDM16470.1 8-oxo-dGTP pyrophosphatase MutT, NUDIX family [Nonomuraea jiangxiensis]